MVEIYISIRILNISISSNQAIILVYVWKIIQTAITRKISYVQVIEIKVTKNEVTWFIFKIIDFKNTICTKASFIAHEIYQL